MGKNDIDMVYDAVRALKGEGYAVNITEYIRRQGARIGLSAVYSALDRLVERGVIKRLMREGGPERGYRQKAVYSVRPSDG